MVWRSPTNHLEENRVNDQPPRIDQNKFQRLNIYTFNKKGVIKARDKNIGDCFCNLGGKKGFSQHNTGMLVREKKKTDKSYKIFRSKK